VGDVRTWTQTVYVDRFATPEQFRNYFVSYYGPTIARLQADRRRSRAGRSLGKALVDLAARHADPSGGWTGGVAERVYSDEATFDAPHGFW
jgi:hypothetical protein